MFRRPFICEWNPPVDAGVQDDAAFHLVFIALKCIDNILHHFILALVAVQVFFFFLIT